jgi:hypothetical protein
MLKMYENILAQGLSKFLESQAKESSAPMEDLRLVIKRSNGKLGAYLYRGSKFMRQVGFAELVRLLF